MIQKEICSLCFRLLLFQSILKPQIILNRSKTPELILSLYALFQYPVILNRSKTQVMATARSSQFQYTVIFNRSETTIGGAVKHNAFQYPVIFNRSKTSNLIPVKNNNSVRRVRGLPSLFRQPVCSVIASQITYVAGFPRPFRPGFVFPGPAANSAVMNLSRFVINI